MDETMEISQAEMDAICTQLGEAFKKDSDELTQADYDSHAVMYYIMHKDENFWIN